MSNTPQQPRPDDAVLGSQYQPPIDGAVLGGIEGLRQRLASDNLEVKKVALTQALNYGEKGIEVLFEVLEKEKSFDIQWSIYQLLEDLCKERSSWWDRLLGKTDNNDLSELQKQQIRKRLENYFFCYEFESVTVNHRGEIIQRTPGKAKYFREDLGNDIYLDMTYIPGGVFMMGSSKTEVKRLNQEQVATDWYNRELPQHRVTIPPFWMGKYAVTKEQYQAVMGYNHYSAFENPRYPVECVSWYSAQAFCEKLSQMTGKNFCLPTEAEWEYACRARTKTPFHFGETMCSTEDLARYGGFYYIYKGKVVDRKGPVAVGTFPPNAFGLYEMHGNIWEWCQDSWHESYVDKPAEIKNNGSIMWLDSDTIDRVVRGGEWFTEQRHCRCAYRARSNPDNSNHLFLTGFRVVCRFPS